MLAGQEWNDAKARDIRAEIDHQVSKVVFFLRSDGAVGQKHERAGSCQASDRMVGVIQASRLAAASSSARGGRSSAAMTRSSVRSCPRSVCMEKSGSIRTRQTAHGNRDQRQQDPPLY